jgi:hypothetical protein
MELEKRDDPRLFFDVSPIGLRQIEGLDSRLKLYTVPGQVPYDSARKAVLSRSDGVMFDAYSDAAWKDIWVEHAGHHCVWPRPYQPE